MHEMRYSNARHRPARTNCPLPPPIHPAYTEPVTSVGNPVEGKVILTEQREAFAALVACGISYRRAAKRIGLQEDYGWDIMQEPAVRDRVIN